MLSWYAFTSGNTCVVHARMRLTSTLVRSHACIAAVTSSSPVWSTNEQTHQLESIAKKVIKTTTDNQSEYQNIGKAMHAPTFRFNSLYCYLPPHTSFSCLCPCCSGSTRRCPSKIRWCCVFGPGKSQAVSCS